MFGLVNDEALSDELTQGMHGLHDDGTKPLRSPILIIIITIMATLFTAIPASIS